MASLMNGLSALGQGVATFAGQAGLELQKAQLANQSAVLADQLATTRETGLQASAGVIAAAAADKTQAAQAANVAAEQAGANTRNTASIAGTAANTAATEAGAMARTQAQIHADPEQIKLLRALGALPADGAPPAGGSSPAATSGSGSAALPGPRTTGGIAADGSVVPPAAGGSTPGASGAASGSSVSPGATPLVANLINKTLGLPQIGSPEATRYAVAQDVNSDPAFKYKTAGQKAAEVEQRVAVAEGKMTDPTSRVEMAKAIASYQIPPLENFALTKPGGPETMGQVMALNPDYQASRYPEINKAMGAFGSGPQGNIIRSLNVGVQHLAVLDQAAQNLNNTDVGVVNTIKNQFAQQFGSTAKPTFDGIKQIVGTEVEKAVAGGIGSASDRDRIMDALKSASSTAQLQAVTDGFRSLMIGQLSGLKTQYEDATGIKTGPFAFESKLVPETVKGLGLHSGGATTPAPAASTAPDPMAMARDAIAQGAPRDAVIKRLQDNGIDPSRLLTGFPPALDQAPGQD